MKVSIVAIGNSRGVRLPKAVLEQVGLSDEAELSIENGCIVISPKRAPRRGWAAVFASDPADQSVEDRDWLDAPLTEETWAEGVE